MGTSFTDMSMSRLAHYINDNAGLASSYLHESIDHAVKAGQALLVAKGKCPHGQWQAWLQDNMKRCTPRTAQRYMQVARYAERRKIEAEQSINDVLRAIAGTPEEGPKATRMTDLETTPEEGPKRSRMTDLDNQISPDSGINSGQLGEKLGDDLETSPSEELLEVSGDEAEVQYDPSDGVDDSEVWEDVEPQASGKTSDDSDTEPKTINVGTSPSGASIVLDSLDREIPDHLRPHFAMAARVAAVARSLDKVKKALLELEGELGTEHVDFDGLASQIKLLKSEFSDGTYWTACVRCGGEGGECARCRGTGYLWKASKAWLSPQEKEALGL